MPGDHTATSIICQMIQKEVDHRLKMKDVVVLTKRLQPKITLPVDEWRQNELHRAAINGTVDRVQQLIIEGAEVNVADGERRTALHWAAKERHGDIVKMLLGAGAQVNVTDWLGRTALHRAAEKGHGDIVKMLLGAGAKVNVTDWEELTALHRAAFMGHGDIVKMLRDIGGIIKNSRASFDCKKTCGSISYSLYNALWKSLIIHVMIIALCPFCTAQMITNQIFFIDAADAENISIFLTLI